MTTACPIRCSRDSAPPSTLLVPARSMPRNGATCPTAISTPAPAEKPTITDRLTKRTSSPSRPTAKAICITPAKSASMPAVCTRSAAVALPSLTASATRALAVSRLMVLVGPMCSCGLPVSSPPTRVTTSAVYSP